MRRYWPRLSRLVSYSTGKSFYTLNAILTNRGSDELAEHDIKASCSASCCGQVVSCPSGTSTCSGDDGVGVVCDGVPINCPTVPQSQSIRESIPSCVPASHPFGRYYLAKTQSGITYEWSTNYGSLDFTYGANNVHRANSKGYFTLTVEASGPFCTQPRVFSRSFYADDCGWGASEPTPEPVADMQ